MPSDAALQRGLLWHSWLKNQILKMDAGYVAYMYSRTSLLEERESFERKIRPGGEFESRLDEARRFAHDMVDGFSPAQLVDSGPLANLSAEARAGLKSIIHGEYLEQTSIEERSGPVAEAVDELGKALSDFRDVWYRGPHSGADQIRAGFEQFQTRARALHEMLGNLPEGIVLP
jgi:hypothetical protein